MSLITRDEQAVEIDRPRMHARKALASLTVSQRRSFLVRVLRAAGVPMAEVAETMRCSQPTARRDARTPTPDLGAILARD